MNLRVCLAGFDADWRFAGSRAFDAWLADRPWAGGGGLCTVRVSGPDIVSDVSSSIERAIRFHDDRLSGVRTVVLDPLEARSDVFAEELARVLEIGSGIVRRRDLLEAAVRLLRIRGHVVLMPPQPANRALAWQSHAACLVDDLRKIDPLTGLTVVTIDTVSLPTSTRAFDFVAGEPTGAALGDVGMPLTTLYRAYAHTRIAWEAGGDVPRALRWSEGLAPAINVMADTEFEAELNRLAVAEWYRVSREMRKGLLASLVPEATRRSRAAAIGEDILRECGLLWSPPTMGRPRVVAWAARGALLREPATAPARHRLRSALACVPLTVQVLARCLELESRCRAAMPLERTVPPTNVVALWEAFRRGMPQSPAAHYPPACPAIPDDPWAFAGLGDLTNSVSAQRTQHELTERLRRLRNCLAHGHYASWFSVREVHELERRFFA